MEIYKNFRFGVFISLLFFSSFSYGQSIDVDPVGDLNSSYNLTELIENVLITGECAEVSNFNAGSDNSGLKSYGYFTNSNPDFPFSNGVILTNGNIENVEGPNNKSGADAGGGSSSWLGDDDLKRVLDARFGDVETTINATYVEFDFVPKNNYVSFNYLFASEEWGDALGYECPGSTISVQDGFAFLIKGTGIVPDPEFAGQVNEWKNIALIPSTTIPVSIGTIYNNSVCDPVSENSNYYVLNGEIGASNTSATQFNAQTTVFKVEMAVIPGETYRIKLVIADRGLYTDYDSAVFLEAGSFNLDIFIGNDRTILGGDAPCKGDLQTLYSNQNASLGLFQWKKLVGGLFVDIPGATGVSLDVATSGSYKLEIELATGCVMEGEVLVEFAENPIVPTSLTDILKCDADNDGTYTFDLTEKNSEILDIQLSEDFQVRYFPTEAALDANTGALNASAYVSSTVNIIETIWARIENKVIADCYEKVSFKIVFYESPVPNPAVISPIIFCDNTTFGDATDGKVVFNLTERATEILNGQNSGFTLSYFSNSTLDAASLISNPTTYVNQNVGEETIYVKMTNDLFNGCTAETSFDIKVSKVPVIGFLDTINQCDPNNDNVYEFNFSSLKDNEILNGQDATVFSINYYKSEVAAETRNTAELITGTYTNTSVSETIWVRLENTTNTNCYVTSSFQLKLFLTAFPTDSVNIDAIVFCDNTTFGDDTDGKVLFDLTEKAAEILNGQNTGFILQYFKDVTMTASSEILTPNTYVNSLASETIFVKMLGAYDACAGTTSFNIKVNALPVINDIIALKQCDSDNDGISDFNLKEANAMLSANYQNETFKYYLKKEEAEQDITALTNVTYFTSGIRTVWARVISTDNCFRIAQVDLIVSVTSALDSFFVEFERCDDILDGDNTNGVAIFDFSTVENQIVTGGYFPAGQEPIITFYKNEVDALAEENRIVDTANYSNTGYPNEQYIYIRVDSKLNNECIGFGPHIKLTVNKVPTVQMDEKGVLCTNDLPKTIGVNTIDPTLTYRWKFEDGTNLGEGSSIEITSEGNYTVIAVDKNNCESSPSVITMSVSEIAILTLAAITVVEDNRNTSISINANAIGAGDYEYVLDEIDGDYQDDPYFGNVLPGIHILYVRDKNLCGIAQIEISILGFPKFFTPNNDNVNDYWNIQGLDKTIFSRATVSIFDRFGKLLKTFEDEAIGWDGSFNGYRVPSSDYWYVVVLVDLEGKTKIVKGNFSLIRRAYE